MKTVLITGADSALGRAVAAELQKAGGYTIIAASRQPQDNGVLLDLTKPETIKAALGSTAPDLVFHLAASFAHDFMEAFAMNVEATRQILESAKALDKKTRVVLAGSAAEYGVVLPEENPIHEDRVLRPVSTYGLTKSWQTELGLSYAAKGVDVVVARIFNLDGPNMPERLFIGKLQKQIKEMLAGSRHTIEMGPLGAIRDYISTADAAAQMLTIARHGETGEIYHVASGIPVKMRDLLGRYLAAHKIAVSSVREAMELSNRLGYDVPEIYADIGRTMNLMKDQAKRAQA